MLLWTFFLLFFFFFCCLFSTATSLASFVPPAPTWKSSHSPPLAAVRQQDGHDDTTRQMQRREWMQQTLTCAVSSSSLLFWMDGTNNVAWASGGATAGKYTTIPIAKRRYYGRVQQAVHEFLQMGPAVVDGNVAGMSRFFDTTATVVVEARGRRDINGQCTKLDCSKVAAITDSRYNDMKTCMYLLGNAFRINQTKAPDNLPTVQAAKAFFKEMDAMEKAVVSKRPKVSEAQSRYLAALTVLDQYLDLVELPPTESGHYDQEFDTLVGESARIT